MDLGLGEGSTGEAKGFLGVDWRRVLMMLLLRTIFVGNRASRCATTEVLF